MKKGFSIFWIIYMMFFAIPFPMLMYYNIKSENSPNLTESNPWFSLALITIAIVLWIILLIGYYRKWVIRTFLIKKNILALKTTGEAREAKILAATKISKPNASYDSYLLKLQFKNLAGSEIIQETTVQDAKPYERRYEVGKTVGLLLDKEIKKSPYFILSSTEVSLNKSVLALINLAWLAFACIVAGYFAYAYQSENEGMGWRFMNLGHPLLICAVVLLFYRFLARLIFNKLLGKPNDNFLIKFKGTATKAKLINAHQTGTYINEQPMINFELEFLDNFHQKHRVNIKKVIGLLELDMTKAEYLPIFYLKENPQKIAFEKDLNKMKGDF